MSNNIVKKTKIYIPKELLHFGIDHLNAAKLLYNSSPSFYDSAGYLSHLGIELILKACCLHSKKEHPKVHKLVDLWNKIASFKQLSLQKENIEWLKELDQHYNLRYPAECAPIETGSDDWNKTEKLFLELYSLMPSSLREQIEKLQLNKKGHRTLMKIAKSKCK